MSGHIKLERKILEWEWWDDINTYRLFTYMLLKANWKDGRFKGIEVPRGSFVSSIAKLSEGTNLTPDEVRTAIKHLKSTGEITSSSHSKFTVFTVKNYCIYQENTEQEPRQVPSKSQTVPTLFPTIEEGKKESRKEKNNTSAPDDADTSPCAGRFQLNDGTYYEITENDVETFQQLYPGIDVRQELRNVEAWCMSNARNRKTRNGAKRFLNGWLSRAQNKAPVNRNQPAQVRTTGFSNFEQRDYDFENLEEQLLQSQEIERINEKEKNETFDKK